MLWVIYVKFTKDNVLNCNKTVEKNNKFCVIYSIRLWANLLMIFHLQPPTTLPCSTIAWSCTTPEIVRNAVIDTVFAEINAHQKQWFFKGGSTQNRWVLMGDFSKGGSTQNRWILMGDFSKGGVRKTDGFWNFVLLLKIKRPGRLFRQIRSMCIMHTQ